MNINKWTDRLRWTKENPLPENYNHEWGDNYNSSWEYVIDKLANYEFDNQRVEQEGDYFARLGRFDLTNIKDQWEQETADIIEESKSTSWEDISKYGQRGFRAGTPMDLQERNDRRRFNAGDDNYTNIVQAHQIKDHYPLIQQVCDFFGFEQNKPRLQIQWPGQFFAPHFDKLWHDCPTNPERILRVFVMLKDWEPGQYINYGNYTYSQWKAGEISTFDHWNTPHSTINISIHARPMLTMIGLRTEKSDAILAEGAHDKIWTL